MSTTTYFDPNFSVRALGLRTDSSGSPVSPDLSAEEDRFESQDVTAGIISPADAYEVTEGSVWNVSVDAGVYALVGTNAGQGTYIVKKGAATTVTLDAADGSNPRIDEVYLVVLDHAYDSTGKVLPRLGYRKGTAAGSPSAPGPDTAWDAYELLATVDLPAAAANIGACTITDERAASQLVVDAPTLEGLSSEDFSLVGHDHDSEYADIAHANSTDGHPDATPTTDGFMSAGDKTKLDGVEASADVNESDAELLDSIKSVDGAGSGLDADLLDGQHASSFATSGHGHTDRYYTEAEMNSKLNDKSPSTTRSRATHVAPTISNGVLTDLALPTETQDDWGGHSGTNSYITMNESGVYLIEAMVIWPNDSGGQIRQIQLLTSTDGVVAIDIVKPITGETTVHQISISWFASASATVRIQVYHDKGSNLVMTSGGYLNVQKIR